MRFKLIIFLMLNLLYCYTGSTFRYGYSARSFALSDAMLADDYQVFQSLSNPASLNKSSGTNYGVSFFKMSLNRSIQTFYFSKELPGSAGLSIAVLRAGVSDFIGKDSFNNSHNDLSMSDYYGLLSFGAKGFGLSIKMHYSNLHVNEQHIDKYTGNSIVLDFGWSQAVTSKLNLAIKGENIVNRNLNWDIDIADGFSHAYSEEYPLILSFGSMYKINKKHYLLYQYDRISIDDDYLLLSRVGYEYNSLKNYFLRLGLKGSHNFRIGFGYIFNINDNFPLIMDYSVDLGSENEGLSHLFTWSFNL